MNHQIHAGKTPAQRYRRRIAATDDRRPLPARNPRRILYGADAQAAAEAEIVRQGLPAAILAQHGINFGGSETLAMVLALILVTLALLNLAGKETGRLLSWIFQPILLALGVIMIPGQLFTAQFLESSFKNSGDSMLGAHRCPALIDATMHVMPDWLPSVNIAKLVLTTLGSLLVIILLAVPSARAHFRQA